MTIVEFKAMVGRWGGRLDTATARFVFPNAKACAGFKASLAVQLQLEHVRSMQVELAKLQEARASAEGACAVYDIMTAQLIRRPLQP